MQDKTKIKSLTIICAILIISLIIFLLYFQFFPSYTDISPKNYFSKTISWNTSVSEFKDLLQFRMQYTSSMFPTIPYDSAILVIPSNKMGNLQEGDIIAFYLPSAKNLVAHRIIKIKNEDYLTKGDNVKYSDQYWVKKEEIIGKVVGILY